MAIEMVTTKRSEMRQIDQVVGMEGGYVLDFSNRTFSEFFEDEFGINIYDDKYQLRGSSKPKLLRGFIDVEDGYLVGQALRKLGCLAALDGRSAKAVLRACGEIESGASSPVVGSLSNVIAQVLSFDTVTRRYRSPLASADKDPEDAVTAACSTLESVCRSFLIGLGQRLPERRISRGCLLRCASLWVSARTVMTWTRLLLMTSARSLTDWRQSLKASAPSAHMAVTLTAESAATRELTAE